MDEKRKIANLVGYRGKLEKFDVDKGKVILHKRKTMPKEAPSWADKTESEKSAVDRRRQGARQPTKSSQRSTTQLDKPKHMEENAAKPTPQKNSPIWEESIFGVDFVIKELNQVTEFTPTFARLLDITRGSFQKCLSNDDRLNRKLTLELLNYHSIVALWVRLLDIKAR